MKKAFLLFLVIFLAFPFLVYAVKTFVVQETEKLSLIPDATDPDSDKLAFYYSPPLDKDGEWQTAYGDAGQYAATVTVSDGMKNASNDILIIVNRKEEAPAIDSFNPQESTLNINERERMNFSVSASDLNKDSLSYEWLVDGYKAKDGIGFAYETNYQSAGSHKIAVVVSDGNRTVGREWNVNVAKLDLQGILDNIPDVNANENDIVRLKLPDFGKYGLEYAISEPLGNKNEWQTNYDSAGTYNIRINAEGNGFIGSKSVRVVVNNVDRPPVFETLQNKVISENEELVAPLNANDPDGDNISITANNMPEGAKLEGNIFAWKPSFDTVKKEDFIDKVVDKFTVLSRSFYIQFAAASNDKKIVQNIVVTVKDADRPPVIEDIKPITINEGDTLRIVPNAYDPDGDKVSLSYSGFASKDTYKSNYGDAGNYTVKISASDGMLEISKIVHVNILHVERGPVFDRINGIKANEGEQIAILLNAYSPEGRAINYSMDNQPEDSSFKGNVFLWAPGYGVAGKGETKKFSLVFAASDGRIQSRQIANAEIKDKNRPPRIINSSGNAAARVNKPVMMHVNAVDDDGDQLAYTWKFGFLESYQATPIHQRIFRTRGVKTVKIIVSDGTDEAEQIINVNVV